MRPVCRGEHPSKNGSPVQFNEYVEARGELIKRFGEYCSYCEMHLDSSLAVEHIQPKKPAGSQVINQQRALNWNNFLLGCTNCNSTKGNKDIRLDDYLWPDRDHTFRALCYTEGGVISVSQELTTDLQQKAQNTIQLVGLDKTPLCDPGVSDRRWLNRKETWELANRWKITLQSISHNRATIRKAIIDVAKAKGYWSIWMSVFVNEPEMLGLLIAEFPGTCEECFDRTNQYQSLPRPGGRC